MRKTLQEKWLPTDQKNSFQILITAKKNFEKPYCTNQTLDVSNFGRFLFDGVLF